MQRIIPLSLALLGSAAPLLHAIPAEACGGFFCSAQQPIDQAAERILFVDHEDGAVTATIEIVYDGPSESFSWVLPVFGEPEVGVSSNAVFAILQQLTNPQYSINMRQEGTCADGSGNGLISMPFGFGSSDFAAVIDEASNGGSVGVVEEGAVGPYEWSLISVAGEASDPAAVATTWLEENGYDVAEESRELLGPYLASGMNLIAFKLQKNASAGAIRPVTLKFDMTNAQGVAMHSPMIPMKLTAVAAQEDMGVMVFHAGASQAVPMNYRSLELNEAAINWFNPQSTYGEVINMAADEAEGHGFVTERAGAMSEFALWPSFGNTAETYFEGLVGGSSNVDLATFFSNIQRFVGWSGFEDVVDEYVELNGLSRQAFLDCVSCNLDTVSLKDSDGMAQAMLDNVIRPAKATFDEMKTRPYLTRMYTTLSAEEMTIDPVFGFNADLPDVSNQHVAQGMVHCNLFTNIADADWDITLPQGGVVRGAGRQWPYSLDDQPATFEISQQGRSGEPELISSNRDVISGLLTAEGAAGSCSCTLPTKKELPALAGLMCLILLYSRRRR